MGRGRRARGHHVRFYRCWPCNLGPVTDSRLPILKALGDNTRYAIYLELARSAVPLSTSDIAESLGLHANTVRPHLERMRDVGLLDVRTDAKGGVGRPQHRYSLASDAPSLGLEPPSYPLLARLLLETAAAAGVGADEAAEIGRAQGRDQSARYADAPSCLEALVGELEVLGFDPAVDGTDDGEIAVIAFTHCPFRELAEAHPELVCALHRGIVEGFVEQAGEAAVDDFHTLAHREPCQVTVSSR
ncbi:MAG: transcriptional regulator [Actinobacteria bacterium]|nr:MAG: transcriptional regulator [Actinomycetota bacterium]